MQHACCPHQPDQRATGEQAMSATTAEDHGSLADASRGLGERDGSLRAENTLLREALRYYARPEHWMALTDEADSPRVVWVARTHLDASANGCSTALQVLMSLVPPPTEAAVALAHPKHINAVVALRDDGMHWSVTTCDGSVYTLIGRQPAFGTDVDDYGTQPIARGVSQ